MTKKDFKKYMCQGLGRCAIVLQKSDNIDKYKDIVLWGCLHNLSFDAQCEVTRADYVYKLSTHFNDEEYFLKPIIKAFEKLSYRFSDWIFYHYCGLLRQFAEDGNKDAKDALQRKYESVLSSLMMKERSLRRFNTRMEYYEELCITLTSLWGINFFLKIADDMGHLFLENPRYNDLPFDWFYSCFTQQFGEKKINSVLKRESKKSENICSFYQNYIKTTEKYQNIVRNPVKTPTVEDIEKEVEQNGKLSASSRARFLRLSEDDEILKLAEKAIAEPNLDTKAELLSPFIFGAKSFPISHEAIIEYSKSSHEILQDTALRVLTDCKSEKVLKYALELSEKGEHVSHALEMMIRNYVPEIKEILLSRLYKLKVDYKNESYWHRITLKILKVQDEGIKLPKEFFLYIYETSLCSCCREYSIYALAKRKALTKDIIEECRFDSNDEISTYVNRYFSGRSRK